MKKNVLFIVALVIAVAVAGTVFSLRNDNKPIKASQTTQPVPYRLETVAGGFSRPVYVTGAGDGSGRLFVVEQSGHIKIIQEGNTLAEPFLDASEWISEDARRGGYTERGLLGLAFDPDYASTGEFFINYTDRRGNTVIARLSVSGTEPNRADPDSATQLFYVPQPYGNHNGGHMAFGQDGYLYVSLGDGGSGGDPKGNGQDRGTLLGTILRLDVRGEAQYAVPEDNPFVNMSGARPEIWAWGLRNVWRFSFDRVTGDLFLADVGQNKWEEINFQPADSQGGENYGWNAYEASYAYSGANPTSEVIMPVLEYEHSQGWCSVTGGYVYRGPSIPDLEGIYLFGDWCTGTLWAAHRENTVTWQTTISLETGRQISSFGEDDAGELFLVDYRGEILRFSPVD